MILTPDQTAQVIELLKSEIQGLLGVYLYGSGATDTFNSESDVDLAIHTLDTLPPTKRWDLRHQLSNIVNREVDLVDIGVANTVLQMQIVATGTRIYTSDFKLSELFDSRVFWNYLTLNEDRREIMEEIAKTGTVYG